MSPLSLTGRVLNQKKKENKNKNKTNNDSKENLKALNRWVEKKKADLSSSRTRVFTTSLELPLAFLSADTVGDFGLSWRKRDITDEEKTRFRVGNCQ